MENKTYQLYNDKAKLNFSIRSHLIKNIEKLDVYLDYINQKYPQSLRLYTEELTERLRKHSQYKEPVLEIESLKILNSYPDLYEYSVRAYLSFIGFNSTTQTIEDDVEMSVKDMIKGFLFLNYHCAKALECFLERKEAIKAYQEFVDYYTDNYLRIEKLDATSNLFTENVMTSNIMFSESFNYVRFVLDEGRTGIKVIKCKWTEVLKELNDPDYAYAIACHYDFLAAKNMNENFVLTRTQTLTTNKAYCDFLWHDTRYDKTCQHPDKSFWDAL